MNLKHVALEAGVSSAAVLYHFDNKDELIDAALDAILDEFVNRRIDLVKDIRDPRIRLATLIVAGFAPTTAAMDDLRILLESVSRLHVDTRYQTKHALITERQLGLFHTTIEIGVALGVFRPHPDSLTVARNMLALEDAYGLYPLVGIDLPRHLVIGNIISCAELMLETDLQDALRSVLDKEETSGDRSGRGGRAG
jgi:AcrR family transcriptional regulator